MLTFQIQVTVAYWQIMGMFQIQVTWTYYQLTMLFPELRISGFGASLEHGSSSLSESPWHAWHELRMAGMCWFMYAIMHAHASSLLDIQAESPKIALPMRSSFAVRGRRWNFPSRSVNRPEPVNGFESTCQTQTSWVNVSYVTSTRNLDEPLR